MLLITLTRGNLRSQMFLIQRTQKIKTLVKLSVNCTHNHAITSINSELLMRIKNPTSIIRVTLILNIQTYVLSWSKYYQISKSWILQHTLAKLSFQWKRKVPPKNKKKCLLWRTTLNHAKIWVEQSSSRPNSCLKKVVWVKPFQ